MKLNMKALALMGALAAGVAGADAPKANPNGYTTATSAGGDPIKNTASASFDNPAYDPKGPNDSTNPKTGGATSNEVVTNVLPLPAFDITYADGTADGQTNNPANSANASTPKNTPNAVPGQTIPTDYALVNNGNTPIVVSIKPTTTTNLSNGDVIYSFPTGTVLTNVVYADTAQTKIISADVTLPVNAVIKFTQTITIPTTAQPNDVFGATPVGVATKANNTANGVPSDMQENQEVKNGAVTSTPAAGTDLQYTAAEVYTPKLNNNPNPITPPTNPKGPDGTTPVTPPPITNVDVPTETVGKPDDNTPVVSTPGYLPPVVPTTPAIPGVTGTDPTPNGTPIVPSAKGDEQIAYPKADKDNTDPTNTVGNTNSTVGTPDTVVFTNTLTNTGGADDKVQLFPALADGTPDPDYTYNPNDGTFTNSKTDVVVRFLDPTTGQPIKPVTGATYPTVTIPNGGTAVYNTEVTYPDKDDSKPILTDITINIGADSLSDAGIVSDASTKDTIKAPAAQFGDSTPGTQGALPTPVETQTVDPSKPVATDIPTSDNGGDSTAVFPMDVANNGRYNDSYTLSGTVDFGKGPVAVKYYYNDGTGLKELTDGVTPVVAPGTEIKVYAVVDVPAGTPSGNYTVSQKAVGNYSTIEMTDLNDVIKVASVGNVVVGKFTQDSNSPAAGANTEHVTGNPGVPSTTPMDTDPLKALNEVANPGGFTTKQTNYLPQVPYQYQIIGKNAYNDKISNFSLSDTLTGKNFDLSGFSTTNPGATIICSDNGTPSWDGSVAKCAWSADVLSGATRTMTLNVVIK